MRKSYFLFIYVFLGLLFKECHRDQINPDLSHSGRERAILDSIKKFDSLTFITNLTDMTKSQEYADAALKLASELDNPEGYILAYSAKAHSFHSSPDSEFIYLTKALKLSDQSNILTHKPNLLSNLGLLYNSAHDPKMAMSLLDSCIRLAEKLKNYKTKSMAFNELGNIYSDAMDYNSAKRYYDSAYLTAQRYSLFRRPDMHWAVWQRWKNHRKKNVRFQNKLFHICRNLNPLKMALPEF